MKSLVTADYETFDEALDTARKLVIRAVQELAAVIAVTAAEPDDSAGGGGGIIHVATQTDPNSTPPHVCQTALKLIAEGLRSSLITEAEISLENRNKAYQHLLDFMLNLKPITVGETQLFEGSTHGPLTELNDLLEPLH
jgi:hypothetical protein